MLIIGNRKVEGVEDGPAEVLKQFINKYDAEYININRNIFNPVSLPAFNIRHNISCIKVLRNCEEGSAVVFFPLHTVPVFASFLYFRKLRVSVVGYDSFYRNYLLLQSRRRGLKNILKNFMCIIYFFLIELFVSRFFTSIFFVSKPT